MKRIEWRKNNPNIIGMNVAIRNEMKDENDNNDKLKKKAKHYRKAFEPFSNEIKVLKKNRKLNYTWGV